VVPEQDPKKDTRTLPEAQGVADRTDILARIVATKYREVERLRGREEELKRAAQAAPPARGLEAALGSAGGVALIAEVKRRSPGAGDIRPGLDPVELATAYASAGAAALSVLTDQDYFGGSLEDLRRIRGAVPVPLLRKDFLLDPLQLLEARGAGADAVLLIVRILEDARLKELLALGGELGMSALVEVHDAVELDRALAAGARILGINNRDLRTFTTRLEVTEAHLPRIPAGCLVVSESGIRDRGDVLRLGAAGVDAVLVGESLLRAGDPGAAAASMIGCPRAPRAGADG
jgi:indole-3-glycerol phosphate synthase